MSTRKVRVGPACATLFFLLGLCFIGRAGVQTDEALFAAALFRAWRFFSIRLFHHNIPVMELSYLGALKTWLYAPIFLIWDPTPALIRVPAILIGAATVFLFGALLERIHGRRAAWIGCILLATDTSFLLTTVYDWGPVALQHLLLAAAMLLAVRWLQTGGNLSLAAASFCCGLAFWDKAVFVWVFTGILCGCILFARAVRDRFTWPRAAIAAAAFCLGALPLIVYNLHGAEKFATVRENLHRGSTAGNPGLTLKLHELESALEGSALFGYIVSEEPGPQPGYPRSLVEYASFAIHALAGDRRRNAMTLALLAALLLLPRLWRTPARQAMLFSAIAACVAWAFMTLSGGGDAAHHIVLLWPLPQLFVAVAFAEASRHFRFGYWMLAAVALLALSNLPVTNQYLYQFIRNGAAETWTDAIYPLALGLKQSHASQVVLPDWGLTDSLCVLNRDQPPTRPVSDPLQPADLLILADQNAIWVDHTPGHEAVQGTHQRVLAAARNAGFEAVQLHIYYDRNGRAIFQTFQFRKI